MATITTKERVPYRIWDKVNSKWNELKFKTSANSVDAEDGDTLETKVGAIKGITTSTNVTTTGFAADASVVSELNTNLSDAIKIITASKTITISEKSHVTCDFSGSIPDGYVCIASCAFWGGTDYGYITRIENLSNYTSFRLASDSTSSLSFTVTAVFTCIKNVLVASN